MPEFHAEPYIYLPAVSHKSALIAWGAFYFRTNSKGKWKIVDDDDLKYKVDIKKKFHPIDAGLAVGLGYRLMKGNGMNFGIQYYYGLLDITIDDAGGAQQNRVLYLTAGIPIGKGKKKKTDQTAQ